MYWIHHLTPQPSRYDGRAQLRHGLRPRTWQVDQTREYQTPLDAFDRAVMEHRKSIVARTKRDKARLAEELARIGPYAMKFRR